MDEVIAITSDGEDDVETQVFLGRRLAVDEIASSPNLETQGPTINGWSFANDVIETCAAIDRACMIEDVPLCVPGGLHRVPPVSQV